MASIVYHSTSVIRFCPNDRKGLSVTMDTKRLQIRSITRKDSAPCVVLFGDKHVMATSASGHTKSQEETLKLVNDWVTRWRQDNPYSGLAVLQKETGNFVGVMVLAPDGCPGQAQIMGLAHPDYWKQGYGLEAAYALMDYARITVQKAYLLNGIPLNTITATARPDNPAAEKILWKLGMRQITGNWYATIIKKLPPTQHVQNDVMLDFYLNRLEHGVS